MPLERSKEWYETRLKAIDRNSRIEAKRAAAIDKATNKAIRQAKKPAINQLYGTALVWKDWNKYKNVARHLTRIADKSTIEGIHLYDGSKYQIDHIVSVWDGFKHNITPELISDISNLRIITAIENKEKGAKSPEIALKRMIELNETKKRCQHIA